MMKTDNYTPNFISSFVETSTGRIAVHHRPASNANTPLLFIHGLFFDHRLWAGQFENFHDRDIYAIDMPLHGLSREEIKEKLSLEDCGNLVLEILDKLQIQKVNGIGHSWGSMSLLRAAKVKPERFESLTLFNMPFEPLNFAQKLLIKIQDLGLLFRKAYTFFAARNLFAAESLKYNPFLLEYLKFCISKLTNQEIRHLNQSVRINADNQVNTIIEIGVKLKIVVAKEDKIAGTPPTDHLIQVSGGHTTPMELVDQTTNIIQSMISIK